MGQQAEQDGQREAGREGEQQGVGVHDGGPWGCAPYRRAEGGGARGQDRTSAGSPRTRHTPASGGPAQPA